VQNRLAAGEQVRIFQGGAHRRGDGAQRRTDPADRVRGERPHARIFVTQRRKQRRDRARGPQAALPQFPRGLAPLRRRLRKPAG
jgi:hypothetical protein